jgi:myo-inositol-1(or 4)-monophosphatase
MTRSTGVSTKQAKLRAIEARMRLAGDLIVAAGREALAAFRDPRPPEVCPKGTHDVTTPLDGRLEAWLRSRILRAFPGDGFLGEESGGTLRDDLWVVDPIDGTANFVRKLPTWCLSIVFVAKGSAEFAFVFHPVSGELFRARRGAGAFLGDRPIRVSDRRHPREAIVELGWMRGRPIRAYRRALGTIVAAGADFVRIDAGGLALAWIACGRLDGYADPRMEVWDGLAGWLLVKEAGGHVSAFERTGLADGAAPIVAATPALALLLDDALRILSDPT